MELLQRARRAGALQERIENSFIGQVAITALVLLLMGLSLVWCMPESALKRAMISTAAPAGMALGLDQDWRVFAPNPPQRVDVVKVNVRLADGDQLNWAVPHGDGLIGQYSWYRWQKLKENLTSCLQIEGNPLQVTNAGQPCAKYWLDLERWVLRDLGVASGTQSLVTVTVHSKVLLPPGAKGTDPEAIVLVCQSDSYCGQQAK
ncbi:MAG: hypothetical protein LLG14_05870 [Nocardiaceae bacterium]|nr:hypothetical protein [Nocardiaceae bacterium]